MDYQQHCQPQTEPSTSASSRINDIRTRALLRLAMNVCFGERRRAPSKWGNRQVWADFTHSSVVSLSGHLTPQIPPRPCCSQRYHAVTGCSGSVQPGGQPITQSLNAGFKLRCPSECFSPFSKITRHRCEERGRPGSQPAAVIMSHISVQAIAALRRAIWLPFWFSSVLKIRPRSGSRLTQARLPALLKVGVGQNEHPLADVRCADFRR